MAEPKVAEVHQRLSSVMADLPWESVISRLEHSVQSQDADLSRVKVAVNELSILVKAKALADDLDPHTLSRDEIRRLWRAPRKAAKEAVESGEYRERRIILEGRVAWTNWWLGVAAFSASLTAIGIQIWSELRGP